MSRATVDLALITRIGDLEREIQGVYGIGIVCAIYILFFRVDISDGEVALRACMHYTYLNVDLIWLIWPAIILIQKSFARSGISSSPAILLHVPRLRNQIHNCLPKTPIPYTQLLRHRHPIQSITHIHLLLLL